MSSELSCWYRELIQKGFVEVCIGNALQDGPLIIQSITHLFIGGTCSHLVESFLECQPVCVLCVLCVLCVGATNVCEW